jgi:hypothetical protein
LSPKEMMPATLPASLTRFCTDLNKKYLKQ